MNSSSKNLEYLTQLLGKETVETYLKVERMGASSISEKRDHKTVTICLAEMEKYSDNPWWLSENKAVLAENQLKCDVLLISSRRFSKILSSFLGRRVSVEEIILSKPKLSKEFFARQKFNTKT